MFPLRTILEMVSGRLPTAEPGLVCPKFCRISSRTTLMKPALREREDIRKLNTSLRKQALQNTVWSLTRRTQTNSAQLYVRAGSIPNGRKSMTRRHGSFLKRKWVP